MSVSGNMIPQSRSMILPPTSTHAQLRPISPRPPRNTIRTGWSATEMGKDLASGVLEPVWSWPERQPALTGGKSEGPQHGFRRHRVGGLVSRLKAVRWHQAGVDMPGVLDVAFGERHQHLGDLLARPVAFARVR